MKDLIYKRKSARKYVESDIDFNQINEVIQSSKTLTDDTFTWKIVPKSNVSLKTGWSSPYYIAICAGSGDLALENIGFVFQQVSLKLLDMGLGSCWVGLANYKNSSITLAFGKSTDYMRSDIGEFTRKSLDKITDINDEKLIPAQYAPSAINSQPWYFKHRGDKIDVFRVKQNILKRKLLENLNKIDIGIALSHLYVTNPETFKMTIEDEKLKGYEYVCTVTI